MVSDLTVKHHFVYSLKFKFSLKSCHILFLSHVYMYKGGTK